MKRFFVYAAGLNLLALGIVLNISTGLGGLHCQVQSMPHPSYSVCLLERHRYSGICSLW